VTIPAPAPQKAKVIAVQWTAIAEDYKDSGLIGTGTGQARMKPVMYDYQPMFTMGLPPTAMSPALLPDVNGYAYETVADMYVFIDSVSYGPYRNEVWSPIRMAHAGGAIATGNADVRPPTVNTDLRYKAKLRCGMADLAATLNAILLATPYVDDVTLFYSRGEVEYFSWTVNP
jgi:hypothetical protein